MKISILQLILLFVVCVTLPFLFNVKYTENMATYPSKTDIVRLSDSSCTDVSCTVVEYMTNRTNVSTSYSTYEKEPEHKPEKKEPNSILDFFKGFFTIEPYADREFVNTNHGNTSEKLQDKTKFINDKGTLIKMNLDTVKYNELFNDADYKLTNIKRDYEIYKATNPGKKITFTNTATASATPAGLPASATAATAASNTAPAVDSTSGAAAATALPPVPASPSLPTGASTSTISGVTLGENEYTQYDKLIDEDLIKMPGKSASEYLRNLNNVNSESGSPTVKKSDDDFINQIEGQLSIIKFFRDLYSLNKESFSLFKETFTSYKEPYDNHNLRDLNDDKTYILENKEKLIYNKGLLTEAKVDNTKYADVLARLNTDIIAINNQYNKFLNDNGATSGTNGGTGTGTASSSTNLTTGTTTGTTTSSTNTPQGVSSRNTATGSNYEDSYDSSCNTVNIKCVADFGTEIGDDLCCGQEGELDSTKYVCPNTMPTCSNYKCGSHFGTCS
jgi:hypothetical protein